MAVRQPIMASLIEPRAFNRYVMPTRVLSGTHDAPGPSCVLRLWANALGTWQGGSYELAALSGCCSQLRVPLARKQWDQNFLVKHMNIHIVKHTRTGINAEAVWASWACNLKALFIE